MDSSAFMFAMMVLVVELRGQDPPYKLCTREGIQCKDCHSVGNCVPNGIGGFQYDDPVEFCPGDIVCDDTSWYCARSGYCRFKKFECPHNNYEDEVVFPDPYSCVLYHGCQGSNQYDYLCYHGTAFNPETEDCSLKIQHGNCKDFPVPLCEKVGQNGTIGGSKYAYMCTEDIGPPRTIYPKITRNFV